MNFKPHPDLLAAYMVGHGPLREPRPLELQRMRIGRYRDLLARKFEAFQHPLKSYVDLNYPRVTGSYDEENFPNLYRLLDDARTGQFQTVLIDIQVSFGPSLYYGWVPTVLESMGLRVINANHDSEGVFEEYLRQIYRGCAHFDQIDDGSDFAAFFPSLASEIGSAALRHLGRRWIDPNGRPDEHVWQSLGHLRQQNPYTGGREPLLQSDLEREWAGQLEANKLAQRPERLKTESKFRLAPRGEMLLIDDYPSNESDARDAQGLAWAEDRVLFELRFSKQDELAVFSYTRDIDSYSVFADIRRNGSIEFFVYPLPKMASSKKLSLRTFSI